MGQGANNKEKEKVVYVMLYSTIESNFDLGAHTHANARKACNSIKR
jgi:hypothetical protein